LEDVKILSQSIDHIENEQQGRHDRHILNDNTDNIAHIIREFSKRRAKDSKTLVRISRELDRPGIVGFMTFILPIILDSIFTNIIPMKYIISPNVITMLQRQDITFQQVARIKRRDRIIQVSFLFSTLYVSYITIKRLLHFLFTKLMRQNNTYARIGILMTFVIAALYNKVYLSKKQQ
jgi:hypothetical protein